MLRYVVRPDSDQPGLWLWVRLKSDGSVYDGCDSSFESQEEAIEDLTIHFQEILNGDVDYELELE